eukprot:TRINITY_DN16537_c0_g1_i1.p1 TRINITY_DN16537_c0_g1~~TRINITY_DN16537_c0_g1_i1.p1  ORF type:complete len:173 (+),score=69.89 TRINITY_DN16537_c0_g1_i1:89-607(+)
MRSLGLGDLGHRMSALHPAYIFAGSGPGIMPSPVPQITWAIMAHHHAKMAPSAEEMAAAAAAAAAAASAQAPAAAATAAPAAEEEPEAETSTKEAKKEAPLKATVTIRLLSFEPSKKIAVVKEARALTGQGLKESKELVEGAPANLKKNVPREEAEALAEKLRAVGAEISLE